MKKFIGNLLIALLLITGLNYYTYGDVVKTSTQLTFGGGAFGSINVSGTGTFGSIITTGTGVFGAASSTAANAITISAANNCIRFEGATADAVHMDLCAIDPTAGNGIVNIPNTFGNTRSLVDTGGVFTMGGTYNFTGSGGSTFAAGSGISLGSNGLFSATDNQIFLRTELTPDSSVLAVGTTSESWHIFEVQDRTFDFQNGRCGTAACGDPTLLVHSRNQNTGQYLQLSSQNATGLGEIQTNLGYLGVGGNKTAITEASAVSILRVGIPTSTNIFGITVFYTVYDINGANYVTRTGSVKIQGGNSGGTATCTINTTQDQETEDGSQIATSNAATLTYTWTAAVSTTNCDLQLNAASSEGVNTVAITWNSILTGNSNSITVTPQ